MTKTRISLIALAAGLGCALAAQAQTAPPPAPPPPPGAEAGHHWQAGALRQRMEERRAAHLKALHDVLGIRPDQEAAFQTFAASLRPEHRGPEHMRPEGRPMDGEGRARAEMTTPERVDLMTRRFDEHTAHMREALQQRASAVKTFYAALSPDQQRRMDALPALIGPGAGVGDKPRWGEGRHGMDGGRHGPEDGMGPPGAGE